MSSFDKKQNNQLFILFAKHMFILKKNFFTILTDLIYNN